jgi:predicted RNA-binding protein with PUA-like domain
MNYWLMKTEPGTFGVEDLAAAARQTTSWDGVRNYQARNMLRDEMRRGDKVLMYHSSCPQPGVVAVMSVARTAYPDETAFKRGDPHFDPQSERENPRWYTVDVKLERRLKRVIAREEAIVCRSLRSVRSTGASFSLSSDASLDASMRCDVLDAIERRRRSLVICQRLYILDPRTNLTNWRSNMAKAKKKAKKAAKKKK